MLGPHEELDLIGQRSYDGDLRSESGQAQIHGELAVVVRFGVVTRGRVRAERGARNAISVVFMTRSNCNTHAYGGEPMTGAGTSQLASPWNLRHVVARERAHRGVGRYSDGAPQHVDDLALQDGGNDGRGAAPRRPYSAAPRDSGAGRPGTEATQHAGCTKRQFSRYLRAILQSLKFHRITGRITGRPISGGRREGRNTRRVK
jgi:hypothetical protein